MHKERPSSRKGATKVVSNDRGHLLEESACSPSSPWGSFTGTWQQERNPVKLMVRTKLINPRTVVSPAVNDKANPPKSASDTTKADVTIPTSPDPLPESRQSQASSKPVSRASNPSPRSATPASNRGDSRQTETRQSGRITPQHNADTYEEGQDQKHVE